MSKIYLAVGHGKSRNGTWDPGCTDGNVTEAALMEKIAGAAVKVLRQAGMTVITDYDCHNNKNMVATVAEANALHAELYLSLHCDYTKAPSGTLPIIYPGSVKGRKLAQAVDLAYRTAMGLPTRGILERDDYEVSATTMPACIFETGSIRQDIKKLQNHQQCGKAIATGILDYLGLKLVKPSTLSTAPKAILLRQGSSGPAVKQLQQDLYTLNYCGVYGERLQIDGLFGSETKYAVTMLQRHNKIAEDGIYGPISDAALMAEVKAIQRALNNLYGFNLIVDGAVGVETLTALRYIQELKGLKQDGICGIYTRAILKI